jgi:hypothetical protein
MLGGWGGIEFQFLNHFSSCCCHMRSSVVMMKNNSTCRHSSALTVYSGFQLLFKHSIIPCTIDRLSTTPTVLANGPNKDPKQSQHHFPSTRHTYEFLGPGQWHVFPLQAVMFLLGGSNWCTHVSSPVTIQCRKASPSSQYHCKNSMHISIHGHLCSSVCCFSPTMHKFCDPKVLMDDANPELISNLLAISVTVIPLPSWTRPLTHSTLPFLMWSDNPSDQHLFYHFGIYPPTGTPSFA